MADFVFTVLVVLTGLCVFVVLSAYISRWFYHQGMLHATKAISHAFNLGLSVEEVKDIVWRIKHDKPIPASYGKERL